MSVRYSPYIKPQSINWGMAASAKLGGAIYPDSFDKRAGTSVSQKVGKIIDTAMDVSNSVSNALGTRSPMYKIGEINNSPMWLNKVPFGGAVRAFYDTEQEGVIIDGIGDVQGEFSVDLTSNPAFYKASHVIDHRYRNPARLKQIVMVSNYLDDNLLDSLLSGVSALDPTGAIGVAKNYLSHSGHTRAQNALYKLVWLMENAKPFRVYTPHGIYDNMLIKSIHPLTDDKKMDMLYCEIQYQEIIFFQPYTNTPGKVPARIGINGGESWSGKAMNTVKGWLKQEARSIWK